MEDDHFAVEVVSIEDHIVERRTEVEDGDVNVLMPVDSKERRVVLRGAGVEERLPCRLINIMFLKSTTFSC